MSSSRPLRIIHVIGTANGGPWLVALAAAQARLGHDVAVILPSLDGTLGPALSRHGIVCHTATLDILSARGSIARLRIVVRLVRLLRRLRPDVVHSHLLPSVVTARIASWIADVPIRIAANAGPLTLESEMLRIVEIGTAFCDTRTVASCTYTRELFSRYGIPESQSELIHYAVEQGAFDPARANGAHVRREIGIADGSPLIGIVAYFYPPLDSESVFGPLAGRGLKGHEVLLHAAPRVLEAFPGAKFALVGRGWGPDGPAYEQQLKELARGLGIANAVIFTGERSDVADALAAFDVSVQPSLTDNLGGTVESLLMARPLVASDIRGFADTVLHRETGLLFPAGDSDALADALIELLRDRELARRLGENGRRRMLDRFTLAHTVAATEEMLRRCCGRAEDHYRIRTTVERAFRFPWRLLPVVREIRRIQRKYAGPRTLAMRIKHLVRSSLKSTARRQTAGGRLRVAQVAAVWDDCDWFINLCRDLERHDCEVIAIIDQRPGNVAARLDAAGIRHYTVQMTFATSLDRTRVPWYVVNIPLAAFRIARILRRERIDIVHSHIFVSVMMARVASIFARTRHVAGITGPRHLEAPLTRKIDRLTWWLDDATLAGCRYTRDMYIALGRSADRLDYAYYGADPARFDPARADPSAVRCALGVAPDAPVVLLIAQFYPPTRGVQTPPHMFARAPKGHEDFIAASLLVARQRPEVRFVMAGGAKVKSGEAYRQRLAAICRADELLRDRVLFTGHVDDVPSLLATANVVVQCSLTENLGGTVEALLMARPVVATRVGGMPESVRDGETGLLVPPSDPASLASAITRLLERPEEAEAFGRAGRRAMLERFTSERTAADVAAVYRRLERGRSPVGAGEGAKA
ncbi:MAG TPA: glycosyltransferase family 4 protein [Thermoanaerobaculia bacterium]